MLKKKEKLLVYIKFKSYETFYDIKNFFKFDQFCLDVYLLILQDKFGNFFILKNFLFICSKFKSISKW